MNIELQNKYLKYKNKYNKLKKKQLILVGGENKNNTVYLFKAEWCGHCVGFKPIWENLKNNLKNKINFISYDADKDKKIMEKFNIQGYPTIILLQKDKAIEYVGNRDLYSLEEFINEYN